MMQFAEMKLRSSGSIWPLDTRRPTFFTPGAQYVSPVAPVARSSVSHGSPKIVPIAAPVELPHLARRLIEEVQRRADNEGLPPWNLLVREAGNLISWTSSLPKPRLIAALRSCASRCQEWDDRRQLDSREELLELIFMRTSADGFQVSEKDFTKLLQDCRMGQGLAHCQEAAQAGLGMLRRALSNDGEEDPAQEASSAQFRTLKPLLEELGRTGLTASAAFDLLRGGRNGISFSALRRMIEGYFAHEGTDRCKQLAWQTWQLAACDGQGEISLSEFERLIVRAKSAQGSWSVSVSSTTTSSNYLERRQFVARLKPGDTVQCHSLFGNQKSAGTVSACLERLSEDEERANVLYKNGIRQQIPTSWLVQPGSANDVLEVEADIPQMQPTRSAMPPSTWFNTGGWFSSSSSCEPGLVGLRNLGNSCYMNALLQCLSGTEDLVSYFSTPSFQADLNRDNFLGSGGAVASAFAALLAQLHCTNGEQRGPIHPASFKATVGKAAEQFSGTEQQDSQEFAASLLDTLHEDLNRVRGRKPAVEFPDITPEFLRDKGEERAAAECWALYLQRDKSIVVDLFQGQMRSQIRCLCCEFVSTKFDSFMYLSLPVVDSTGAPLESLGDCLKEFSREELLTGRERWLCPKCKVSVDAAKTLSLWKVPPILLVHLKRFRFDSATSGTSAASYFNFGIGRQSASTKKLNHMVDFSPQAEGLTLDGCSVLPANAPQKAPPIYNLYALVDHFGSCGFGHYTAAVCHPGTNRWYRFDDEHVMPIETQDVVSPKAYLLFFRRRDGLVRAQTISAPEEWPHVVQRDWNLGTRDLKPVIKM